MRLRPEDRDALRNLGHLLELLGDTKGALEFNQRAMKIGLAAYQQVIVSDPENAEAHYNIGLIYGALGQRTEELHAYLKTVEADANHADAWKRLGNLLYQSRNFSGAEKAYREVVRLRPEDKDALRNLGHLLELLELNVK